MLFLTIPILCLSNIAVGEYTLELATQQLQSEPSEVDIQTFYYPYDKDKGWYIHNTHRESLINKKLKECKYWQDKILPICDPEIKYKEQFWQNPYFIVSSGVVLFFLGMIAGSVNAK